jgi:hypothetical protein
MGFPTIVGHLCGGTSTHPSEFRRKPESELNSDPWRTSALTNITSRPTRNLRILPPCLLPIPNR